MTPYPAVRSIAIIGAGRAGQGFAQRCLRAGLDVLLEDVMPANLRNATHALGPTLCAGRGRLTTASTVEEAVREADLAIDFVPDELESKLEIFSMVDRMAPPRTILCTPTDTLSITDLASCTYRPERCFSVQHLSLALEEATTQVPAILSASGVAERTIQDAVALLLTHLGLSVEVRPDRVERQLTRNA